jgi:hypothetical protein
LGAPRPKANCAAPPWASLFYIENEFLTLGSRIDVKSSFVGEPIIEKI